MKTIKVVTRTDESLHWSDWDYGEWLSITTPYPRAKQIIKLVKWWAGMTGDALDIVYDKDAQVLWIKKTRASGAEQAHRHRKPLQQEH